MGPGRIFWVVLYLSHNFIVPLSGCPAWIPILPRAAEAIGPRLCNRAAFRVPGGERELIWGLTTRLFKWFISLKPDFNPAVGAIVARILDKKFILAAANPFQL